MLSRQRSSAAGQTPLSPRMMQSRFVGQTAAAPLSPPAANVLKDRSTNLDKDRTISTFKRQKANDKQRRGSDSRNDLDLPDFLLDDSNPFTECHEGAMEAKRQEDERQQEEAEAKFLMECDDTTVSSLASGSFKVPSGTQRTAAPSGHEPPRFVPPKYICIRSQSKSHTGTPGRLMESQSDRTHYHQEIGAKVSMDESDCPRPPPLRYRRQSAPQWSPPLPPSQQHRYPFNVASAAPKQLDEPLLHQQHYPQPHSMTPAWNGPPLSPVRPSPAQFHSPYSRSGSTRAVALVSPCNRLDNSCHSQQPQFVDRVIPPPPLMAYTNSSAINGPSRKHKRAASSGIPSEPPTPSGSVKRTSAVVQELRSFWNKVRNNDTSATEISIPGLTMTESTVSPPHGCLT